MSSIPVYLVSCVAQKRDCATRASDLYTSPWFRYARSFVERTGSPWFILSAKYGLVGPEDVVAPYEQTLNAMGVGERRIWAKRVMSQMDNKLPAANRIVVFAGSRYREFLMDYLKRRFSVVEVPLEGLRIGEQLHWFGECESHGSTGLS